MYACCWYDDDEVADAVGDVELRLGLLVIASDANPFSKCEKFESSLLLRP